MYKLRIKEIRLKKGWTIKALAERSGVSRSFITELEEGLYTPTIATICRLCKAFDCTITDLVECNRKDTH